MLFATLAISVIVLSVPDTTNLVAGAGIYRRQGFRYYEKCDDMNPCPPHFQCTHVGGNPNTPQKCAFCPCVNGYCLDGLTPKEWQGGTAQCVCNLGWTGQYCDQDINECSSSSVCTSDAYCTNTPGSFTCTCCDGFTGDGLTGCTAVNECIPISPCGTDATCADATPTCDATSGVLSGDKFTCTCNTGYNGNGFSCHDINECSSSSVCTSDAYCANTPGSFTCTCCDGFTGDGVTDCTAVNECIPISPCGTDATCADITPTCDATTGVLSGEKFTCTCNTGYAGNGFSCQDINECSSSSVCTSDANCTNTPGSFTCTCCDGFTGDGLIGCTAVNECIPISPCGTDATCADATPTCDATTGVLSGDKFTCTCNTGYAGNGFSCQDINECSSSSVCTSDAYCTNTPGSFTCTCCDGFTGDGLIGCYAVNECIPISPCGTDATCADATPTCDATTGVLSGDKFTCTCNTGYAGNGFSCQDINECSSSSVCTSDAYCTNTPGSFTCTCCDGFTGDGLIGCYAVNECIPISPCGTDATCADATPTCDATTGVLSGDKFTCTCNTGYAGNGFSCQDINECSSSSVCTSDAYCANTPGSFTCTCCDGFTGDGVTDCTAVNECSTITPCGTDATCTDATPTCDASTGVLSGDKFTCTCNDGYDGDGYNCIALALCSDSDPLVSGPDGVDDSKITASTYIATNSLPKYGRLNMPATPEVSFGAWVASQSDSSPYIQVEFSTTKTVHFIQTQGSNFFPHWVIDYSVAYSVDCSSFDVVTDSGGGTKTFPGNADMNTVVTNAISPPIQARCIRLQPLAFNDYRALRFEVLGCE